MWIEEDYKLADKRTWDIEVTFIIPLEFVLAMFYNYRIMERPHAEWLLISIQ